jgi:acyl-CoA synthetase (AMP-forming)/AMP-acid ligase II
VAKAFVVLKPNEKAGEVELIEHCRSRLAHYKCPQSVEFLESLPRTGTGKVLKRDLRKKVWQGRETLRTDSVAQSAKGREQGQIGNSGERSVNRLAQKQ